MNKMILILIKLSKKAIKIRFLQYLTENSFVQNQVCDFYST